MRKFGLGLVIRIVLLGLLTGCASVQYLGSTVFSPDLEDSPPVYELGNWWLWSDGYFLRVSTVLDGGVVEFQRDDPMKQWFRNRNVFIRESSQSGNYKRESVFRDFIFNIKAPLSDKKPCLFPLRTLKSLKFINEYTVKDLNLNNKVVAVRRHETTWNVLGKESIRVPAVPEELESWVIEMHSKSLTGEWQAYEKWWYAPKIKHYARMEFDYTGKDPGYRVLMRTNVLNKEEQNTTPPSPKTESAPSTPPSTHLEAP